MKLEDLGPNPQNPRRITDEKLKMLKKSIDQFGDLSGFVYNLTTKRLVGGHQRKKVIPKESEITIINKYPQPTKSGTVSEGFVLYNGERFTYREVLWDETTEKAANIAANQHGGEFDLPGLTDWINELDAANIDMDLLGFDEKELTNLMAPISKEGLCDEDEMPEQVEPKTKLGDLYRLGNHRLLCGDSTDSAMVSTLVGQERMDMVFTDPPYGMNLDADYSKMGDSGKNHKKIIGDDKEFDPSIILSMFEYVDEIFLWGFDYYAHRLPYSSSIVWDKRSRSNEEIGILDGAFGSDFELCWSKNKHKKEIARILRQTGAFSSRGEDKSLHPTQKPIALVEWFFERWGKETKTVIDLFGGSGSTLIACEKTNRKCFMMELDPHYCDVIVARWEKYTGQKAELINEENRK